MILVGGWTNPSLKIYRQIGSCPQGENEKLFETTNQLSDIVPTSQIDECLGFLDWFQECVE